jgi:hypothetical protein
VSGKVRRGTVSTAGGHRNANQALWRLSWDPRTRHYMERRTKEGRSKREVIRDREAVRRPGGLQVPSPRLDLRVADLAPAMPAISDWLASDLRVRRSGSIARKHNDVWVSKSLPSSSNGS